MKYAQGQNIRVFKPDQEATQNLKVEALKKAGIENNWISYVPIDFNNENEVYAIDFGIENLDNSKVFTAVSGKNDVFSVPVGYRRKT